MVKIKHYSFKELERTKNTISDAEAHSIIGGYRDLGNGYVSLSYEEMVLVFGCSSAFPSYASFGPDQDGNLSGYSDNNCSNGGANSDYEYVVRIEDLGRYADVWGLGSSSDIGGSQTEPSTPIINTQSKLYLQAESIASSAYSSLGTNISQKDIDDLASEIYYFFEGIDDETSLSVQISTYDYPDNGSIYGTNKVCHLIVSCQNINDDFSKTIYS